MSRSIRRRLTALFGAGLIGAAIAVALPARSSAVDDPPPPAAQGAARSPKATLAIVPFTANTAQIARDHGAELDRLYDTLVRLFLKSNKFDVVERTRVQSVVDETHFSTSSIGDPANAVQFGKLTGAQYLVVGEIVEIGVQRHTEKIPYVSEVKCTERARIRVEARVVQTRTGRIVSAEIVGGAGSPGPCSGSRRDVLESRMNKVVADLVSKVVDSIYPLKVAAVSGGELTLNRGEGSAFQVGSTLECFTTGEAIFDPDTGEVLGAEETPVGTISITKIMPKLSKAKAEGEAWIPPNAVCRLVRYEPPPKPAPKRQRPKVNF